jgi:hypothetical protein
MRDEEHKQNKKSRCINDSPQILKG